MAYEKVVAVFDTTAHADAAVRALEAAGFRAADISKFDRSAQAGIQDAGLWQHLFGEGVQKHEAEVYGQTISKGGVVVVARVMDTQAAQVMSVLENHHPIDLRERAETLGIAAAAAPRAAAAGEEIVRLAEEELNVGKRQIAAGTTRIRRFVVEKPVEAQVTLHEEHATVVRRAVADPTLLKDIDWSDKIIEVTETAEEAVVSKSTRLAEEVVIRKEGSDRVETVRDTVRRQQIEVERVDADTKKVAPKKV
jgi:uncharacterized protein (TIGR02271 family)